MGLDLIEVVCIIESLLLAWVAILRLCKQFYVGRLVVSITWVGIWFCIVESFASCMGCNPLILSSRLASSLGFAD